MFCANVCCVVIDPVIDHRSEQPLLFCFEFGRKNGAVFTSMRRSLRILTLAAPEFATALLRTGRVADMDMMNHFSSTVQRALSTAAAAAPQPAVVSGSPSRQLPDPRSFIGEVYGVQDWYCSPESPGAFTVKKMNGTYVASGKKTAIGGNDKHPMPSSVVAVATVVEGDSTRLSTFRIALPNTACPTAKVTPVHQGIQCVVELLDHPCTDVLASAAVGAESNVADAATNDLTRRRVQYCENVADLIESLEYVCALHSTSAVRYDNLLLRDQSAQKTIATLRCTAFAIRALASYVAETTNPSDAALAKIFASSALETAASAAKHLVGPLVHSHGTHTVNPNVVIAHDYVHRVASLVPDLQHTDGWNSDIATFALGELLSQAAVAAVLQRFAAAESPLSTIFSTSTSVRLTGPHLNLNLIAQVVEKDATALLSTLGKHVSTKQSSDRSLVVDATAAYVSEIFASTAVIYRCTGALLHDEEGAGQREWLLTQGFCDLSRARRADILQRLSADETSVKGVWGSIHGKDYDEVAVHPVEVGMMKAAPKTAAAKPK